MNPSNQPSDWPFGEYSLAAVMFTDVVGFSLRAGEDEREALSMLQRDFALMGPVIARYQGHLLKTLGDGQLVCFQSAANAVNCAIAIQHALREEAIDRPDREILLHRIGIHLGDVFVSESDVNGNGVNIASRLQGRAEPGGICISQTVYDVVRHLRTIRVNYLGPQELKNIREAVPIYHVFAEGVAATAVPQVAGRSPETGIALTTSVRCAAKSARKTAADAFRIAVVGDFGGRASRGLLEPWSGRAVAEVDPDTIGKLLSRVELRIPGLEQPDAPQLLKFRALEDFHPDRFARHCGPLWHLADLRKRIERADPAAEAEAEAMFRLLPEAPAAGRGGKSETGREVDAIVRGFFGSGGGQSRDRAEELLEKVDGEMTRQLRAILSHPDFKRLEAGWTALSELSDRFADDDDVSIYCCDVSRGEFMADLLSESDPGAGLRALLDDGPWAMVICDHAFAPVPEDIAALEVAASVCCAAGTPMVAAADPRFVGCESFRGQPDPADWQPNLPTNCRDRWEALRLSDAARFLALTAPRHLLRTPYGKGNDPIGLFPFDELPATGWHEFLLWGNPAFLIGRVLAEAYLSEGWALRADRGAVVDERPLHRDVSGGGDDVTPFAEAWLSERAVVAMLDKGIIPLVSDRSRDLIRIPAIQSVSRPPRALAGPWPER